MWGEMREVDPKTNRVVKSLHLSKLNWIRTINTSLAVVHAEFTTALHKDKYPFWPGIVLNLTIDIAFVRAGGEYTLNGSENLTLATPATKFSIGIEGNWNFSKSQNQLHLDWMVESQQKLVSDTTSSSSSCNNSAVQLIQSDDAYTVSYFTVNGTKVELSLSSLCALDRLIDPALVKIRTNDIINNTLINVTLIFPSFRNSLEYDPSLAMLIGSMSGSGSCSSVLDWILPVSFIAAAIVVCIIFIIAVLYYTPFTILFLGSEGYRIQMLRKAGRLQGYDL